MCLCLHNNILRTEEQSMQLIQALCIFLALLKGNRDQARFSIGENKGLTYGICVCVQFCCRIGDDGGYDSDEEADFSKMDRVSQGIIAAITSFDEYHLSGSLFLWWLFVERHSSGEQLLVLQ